jgi:isopenicillin N synthase-like dioxygenase
MIFDANSVTAAVLSDGWAKVIPSEEQADRLTSLLDEATNFFGRPQTSKEICGSADGNHGYRAMGREYSITPDRPDVNESFSLWSDRLDLIPAHEELGDFGRSLLAWQETVADISAAILSALARRHFDAAEELPFRAASSVQINSYAVGADDRECLQDRHEDGHVFTLVHGTKPGLEIFVDDVPRAIDTARDELLVMPGAILSALTGDRIAPLFHQVRNLRLSGRQSIMYFVNPELDDPVRPWVGDTDSDLREVVRNRPSAFGLPAVPTVK